MWKLYILLLVLMFGGFVSAFPQGASTSACSSLTPGHGGSSQSLPSPYTLNLSIFDLYNDGNFYYQPGYIYQLTLSGGTFRGFLLQARLMSDDTTLVGLFTDLPTEAQFISCSSNDNAITHTINSDKVSITGTWTAPPLGTGPIRFRFAVVQTVLTYWADIMSDVIYESGVNMSFDGALLPNNSVVVRGQVGIDDEGITCYSENVDCCSDSDTTSIGWFYADGEAVYEGEDGAVNLYVTRGAGFVRLNRISGGATGLYWCDVPIYTGDFERFYVGLYTNSIFSGAFLTVMITFELETELTTDPPQFSLTCRSDGGPVTTVEWERDGVMIQDDNNHSSSQIVVDPLSVVYHNVLVVTGRNGGEYMCTVINDKTSLSGIINVEVGTDPTNLTAIQQDLSGTSILVNWQLPSLPEPTGNGFAIIYETTVSSDSISVDFCNDCEVLIPDLMVGSVYNISVVTESEHLPSNIEGPVSVVLATGCVELGYTDGCCVISDPTTDCILDLPETENDCFCHEQCYSLGNCCQDILLSCPPPDDADLCALFRGYNCVDNAQCQSVGGQVDDSSSYQCVCSEGYIGDGNTTCLGDSVIVNPSAVLVVNGSSGAIVYCEAPSFSDSTYHWILVSDDFNTTVATGNVFELNEVVFGEVEGNRYQCIVETEYGNIFSELVEVIVSPQGGVSIEPAMPTVERGESIILTCTALGGPGNIFSWTQSSTALVISSEAVLTVSISSGGDGGVYRCSVENDAGNGNAFTTIIVPPVFDQSPTSIVAQIGSDVALQCHVDGYPTPNIEWIFYSTFIREGDGIEINNEIVNSTLVISTLNITSLQTEQYGQYQCRADGTLDSNSATISFTGIVNTTDCDIIYNLTETSNTLTVGSTETVCFRCLYNDSIDAGAQWTLNDEEINNSTGTTFSGYLVIFSARHVFSVDSPSMLQCIGTSIYNADVTIRVLEPPSIPETINIIEYDDVVLLCDSSGSIPVISHTWSIEGGNVVSSNAELVLLNISRTQDGVYTCTIENDIGETESAMTTINVLNVPRVIDFSPSPHNVLIGEQLELFCIYSGTPQPVIEWLVNDTVIISGADITITTNTTHSILTVNNVTATQDGVYTCNASNLAGSDQESIIVNTFLTPPPATLTITVADGSGIAGETYTLTCLAVLTEGAMVTTDVEWLGTDGEVLTTQPGIIISDIIMIEDGVKISRDLTFVILLTSQAGEYTCRAGFPHPDSPTMIVSSNQTTLVTVQIPEPVMSITSPVMIYEGTIISLVCTAMVDVAVDSEVEVMFTWTYEGSDEFSEFRFNISEHRELPQVFVSTLEINPITLTDSGDYSCSVVVDSSIQYIQPVEESIIVNIDVNELPLPMVEITDPGESVAGDTLSLTCTVTTVENLVLPPHVEFLNTSGEPLEQQDIIIIGTPSTEGVITTLEITFLTLLTSHGGQYICRATINIPQVTTGRNVSSESIVDVIVTLPSPMVLVTPGNNSAVAYAAIDYCLVCQINFNATLVNTAVDVLVSWTNEEGQSATTDIRISASDTVGHTDDGYSSVLTFSPLSLTDSGDYICSVTITPSESGQSFVIASSPVQDTYTIIDVIAPPEPNLTLILNGSEFAGETLEIICISEYLPGIFRSPSITILGPLGMEFDQYNVSVVPGMVRSTVLLDPLLTSHGGVFTCVSTYDFTEVGLTDPVLYSTQQTIVVTVSIPPPEVLLAPLMNETYVGTVTYLYCTVQLDPAVDTELQVSTSIIRIGNNESYTTPVTQLSNIVFQSSIVFNPLVTEDEDEYMCNVTVESSSEYILGTFIYEVYSLIPLDTPEPVIVIEPEDITTLGTNVSLICRVTTVEGLFHPPLIYWQQLPDPDTVIDNQLIMSDANMFWYTLDFKPLLVAHGGLYTCSATLVFPNTSLPNVSATQDYTLTVQAPVPYVMITQDPIGDIIEGTPVILQCLATVPSPNAFTFSITIQWINTIMSEPVTNSSDGRVVVGSTIDHQPNGFLSLLMISAVNIELDSTYSCIAQTILQESGPFITAQHAISNASLVIVGPPSEFVVEEITQNSISFKWGLPITPATVNRYELECHVMVIGIEDPPLLVTTEQNATLLSLSPGLLYSCSLTAITDSNMPPPATVTATTLEAAPSGPVQGFIAVPVDARSITFMWEEPEPHLQNGVILSYTITCDPSPDDPLKSVSEAGSITVGGFSPLTTYNCSVSASNSAGSGPLAYYDVTTGDDTTLIQIKVLGVENCVSWKAQDEDEKLADITSAVVDNINKRCDCDFTTDNVLNAIFLCFSASSDSVTFRAGLLGLADVNSTVIAAYVVDWVATGQTVFLQGIHFLIDSNCKDDVVIDDLSSPECTEKIAEDSSSSQQLDTGSAAGITAAAILVVVTLAILVIISVVLLRRRYHAKVTLRQDPSYEQPMPAQYRGSTSSVKSDEMVYNPHYQTSSFIVNPTDTKNPLYSNPSAPGSDLARAKHGTSLPPLPEEPDGYAVPSIIMPKSTAKPPIDYMKPVTQEGDRAKLLPLSDDSTMFTNRSSGIYEDPDYVLIPERKPASSDVSDKAAKGEGNAITVGSGGAAVGEYEIPSPQHNSVATQFL